jgi:hypothetical protein
MAADDLGRLTKRCRVVTAKGVAERLAFAIGKRSR